MLTSNQPERTIDMDVDDRKSLAPLIYRLPFELLALIAWFCPRQQDVSALSRASRRLHKSVGRLLYETQVSQENYDVVFWAAEFGRTGTLKRWISACDLEGTRHAPLDVYSINRDVDRGGRTVRYIPGPFDLRDRQMHSRFWTPLHRAAQFGHLDTVDFLLDHGCDVNAQSLGLSPHGLSCFRDARDRANAQVDGCVTLAPLHQAIISKQAGVAKRLLERGAEVNIMLLRREEPCGVSALHLAAAHGLAQTVTDLVEGGHADVNQPDKDGLPPMLYAAEHEANLQCMGALRDLGADLNIEVGGDAKQPLLATLIERVRWRAAAKLIDLGASVDVVGGTSTLLELCERAKMSVIYPDTLDLDAWDSLVTRIKGSSPTFEKPQSRVKKFLALARREKQRAPGAVNFEQLSN